MASASRQIEDIETARIPILGSPGNRGTDQSKDQRFVNGYFWEIKNPITGKAITFFVKRPGLVANIQPSGGAAAGRGVYGWKGSLYSVFGTKLYKDTADLGVTIRTTTGLCTFAETRPGATTQYLCMTDGTDLFCINTSGNVVVLNNKAITSSSMASPTVITATAHGLETGNRIVIRGHTGSTPSINGTVYTVTKITADTFNINETVTIAGTGGTIGIFPSPNSSQLLYVDGYIVTMKPADLGIYNCELDDPLSWDLAKFITPQMFNGAGIGIAKQNNLILAFSSKSVQAFYDNANATGSPFSVYESATQQVGCASVNSIADDESVITWVGNSFTGGNTVYKMEGVTGLDEIADDRVRLLLDAEGSGITSASGVYIRIGGKRFYVLTLYTNLRTLVYDYDIKIWTEFESASGGYWPTVASIVETDQTVVTQHPTNGWLYVVRNTAYQDDGVDFTVMARFGRLDLDTGRRKFVRSYELVGDKQSTTTNVLFQYSDDDYTTLSTARTFNMNQNRPLLTRGGSFYRRAHQISYTGSNPFRVEALEMRYRLGLA